MFICLTNRKLCKDNFFHRIEQLAKGKPHAILLREKDLDLADYGSIAIQVKEICNNNQVPLIIHQNLSIASKLGISHIHLSLQDLRAYKDEIHTFTHVGASIHSISEAKEAQKLGASYLVAGHIFSTDCKKGVSPRGLSFLKEVCDSVTLPVFAIGGITKDKVKEIRKAGAKGICVMSEAMTCPEPITLVNSFELQESVQKAHALVK